MKGILFVLATMILVSCAEDPTQENDFFAVTDTESYLAMKVKFGDEIRPIKSNDDKTLFFANAAITKEFSTSMHTTTNRCGGFFAHENLEEALVNMSDLKKRTNDNDYEITQTDFVKTLTAKVDRTQIESAISHLTTYHNRYYKAETGVESMNWIKDTWERLNQRGDAFNVELFEHDDWMQPTVMATWEGSEFPEEVVVLGGHGDSINVWGLFRSGSRAPGADDNASGVSTITEVIRVLMNSNYRPKRTIKFFAYAAEEVGLRGSREVAKAFNRNDVNVIAAMQLDMTNHNSDDTIAFIRDYTDDKLSLFVQELANEHLDVAWVDDKCGYACSDHASWTAEGFASVFPFESRFGDMNKKIHTKNDTLDNSDSTARHASHFAKLGLAYVVEVAK